MFYQIFVLPKEKWCAIVTDKHGIYELPHESLNLRLVGNIKKVSKRPVHTSVFRQQCTWQSNQNTKGKSGKALKKIGKTWLKWEQQTSLKHGRYESKNMNHSLKRPDLKNREGLTQKKRGTDRKAGRTDLKKGNPD